MRKTDYQDIETVLHIQRRYVEFLRTPVTGTWSAAQALPDDLLPAPPEQAPEQTSTMLFWYWLYRGMAHFTCGEYADAQADLEMRAGMRGPHRAISICWITIFTARWRSPASLRRRPSRRIIAAVFITITTKLPSGRGSIRARLPIKRR